MKATLLALTTMFALAISACSSSDDGGTTTKKDSGTDGAATETGGGTDTGTASVDTGTATEDTGGTPSGDDACFAAADNNACQTCCSMNHKEAYNAFVTTLVTCGCKAGNCDTACKTTVCASPMMGPDAACNTCLGMIQSGACKMDLQTACGPSGPCSDFAQCASGCPM